MTSDQTDLSQGAHRFDVFDVHQHVGTTVDAHAVNIAESVSAEIDAQTMDEVRTRLRIMDEAGTTQALVSPGHSYDRTDGAAATRRQNDQIAAYRDQTPDRFPIAAGIVEPTERESGLTEISRMSDELGLVGVSLHVIYQGVTMDSQWVLRYLERMGELGMVPLVHAPDDTLSESLWRLGKVARSMPDLTFLALEPFYTYEGMLQTFFIADVAPNIVFETASCTDFDLLESFVREFGAHRVLYGSQFYSVIHPPSVNRYSDRRTTLLREEIAASSLTESEKAAILGGNARSLFGRWLDGPTRSGQ